MEEGFRKMLDGVRQADEGRDAIMAGLEEAWTAGKGFSAQLTELRETVTQLQQLVLSQTEEVRQLRARLDRNGPTNAIGKPLT